ncbi:PREDICTED: sodium-coupled neutral amino acid transporter 1-like [Nicrophorus vespilloides]|uniref:Sodium-coupled neutral amino acid transporter 1-like n=1 Tax=Nicrophorus vespilloides TaxID=110193 RepID=A0ABM1MIG0_NICVS|nr:PREDICTED: sodium-coupled neutral amino acid transporter 1-like [Nicrophorus vespilloides]
MITERTLLLAQSPNPRNFTKGLSVVLAAVCIVDVFGVFPIISLPKSIIDCGYYGIAVVISICSMQIYTAILLGKCWLIAERIDPEIHSKNRYPYSALADLAFGPSFRKFVTFLVDITIFGGGIPNLIVASQNLQLLGLRLSENSFDLSSCYWIIILGLILCPLLWMGSPKDMKLICTISVCMVTAVFLLVLGCILFDFDGKQPKTDQATMDETISFKRIIAAYGILAFQFDIHPSILTIQLDMKNKSKITSAVILGFGISVGMFSLTVISCAFRYGNSTQRSLLGTLPSSIFLHVAALLVAIQLCLTSAVSNNALYQHMEDCLGIARDFNHRRCLLRTSLCLLAIFLAEAVPRLDIAMSLIGGTLVGPLVFIIPPLIYLKITAMKRDLKKDVQLQQMYQATRTELAKDKESEGKTESQSKTELFLCIFIMLFGFVSTFGTSYINIINTIDYARFTEPCLYNLTLN